MSINRRSFLRTVFAAAALCVVPSFVCPTTKRLLAIEQKGSPFVRCLEPQDTLTVTYTRRLDDLVLYECERSFEISETKTIYGAKIGVFDDGTYEVIGLIDQAVWE